MPSIFGVPHARRASVGLLAFAFVFSGAPPCGVCKGGDLCLRFLGCPCSVCERGIFRFCFCLFGCPTPRAVCEGGVFGVSTVFVGARHAVPGARAWRRPSLYAVILSAAPRICTRHPEGAPRAKHPSSSLLFAFAFAGAPLLAPFASVGCSRCALEPHFTHATAESSRRAEGRSKFSVAGRARPTRPSHTPWRRARRRKGRRRGPARSSPGER